MDLLFRTILVIHICSGFTSLGLFFIPMFARKGGKLHNRVGRWYTYGMWGVIISAIVLSGLRMLGGYYTQAMFLGFLALLTARPLYYGIAILKNKQEQSDRLQTIDRVLRTAVVIAGFFLAGVGMNWWGPANGHPLLVVFGSLGFFTTIFSVIRDFKGTKKPYHWLEEHISGLLISAIAAFTAFFSFGGNRVFGETFTGNLQLVTWIAPTVIGVATIRYYKWKLKLKAPQEHSAANTIIPKTAAAVLLIVTGGNMLSAQVYTEKQSRHRFAQFNFGAGLQAGFGGNATFDGVSGLETMEFGQSLTPQLSIGGTHFWGHADFQITFPIGAPTFQQEAREVQAVPGVETIVKWYPWRIESGKVRPYFGTSLLSFYYRQKDAAQAFGTGPAKTWIVAPIKTGITFNQGNHLFEAGINWNYANQKDYFVNPTTTAAINLPPVYASLTYRYQLDTSVGAEKNWENGKTKAYTDRLAAAGKLNNFFIGIAPSSAWWNGKSSHNSVNHPAIEEYPTSIMLDFAAGYYFHKPDLNINVSYRSMNASARAYGTRQSLNRQSVALEATKMLADYHGFIPFLGPVISRERLTFSESVEGNPTFDVTEDKWAAGITFGWDIRPNRVQSFLLRTNLRYYPNLKLDLDNGENVSFGAVEFNFIQLVIFPERMF